MLRIPQIQRLCRLLSTKSLPITNSFQYITTDIRQQKRAERCIDYCRTRQIHVSQNLHKYDKKSSRASLDEDSDEEDGAEFKDERDSKVIKTKVNSLRADLLLKSGLNMARNKVETIFYESKIRVNGKKIQKKSIQLNVGDEIDVIRGFSQMNTSHLVVSRVIILSANEQEEGLSVQLRRYKSLLIENYAGANAFKSSEVAAH